MSKLDELMNDFYKEQALDSLAAKAKSKIANDAEQAKKDTFKHNTTSYGFLGKGTNHR